MRRPAFSVITANYNSGQKLSKTAASVLGQSNAELIIVDKASTDGSREVAEALAIKHPSEIRLLSEEDCGIYDAFNKGLHLAKGRYVYFIGAGDEMKPGILAAIEPSLPSHDLGLIYGNVILDQQLYDGPFNARKLCTKNICQQAIFYGKDIFRICGSFSLRYRTHADYEFNIRAFGCRQIAKRYVALTIATFEPNGVSSFGDETFFEDMPEICQKHLGVLCYFFAVRWPLFRLHLVWLMRQMLRRFMSVH